MIEQNFICFVLFTLTLFISDISKLYGQEKLSSQKKLLIQEKQPEQKKRLPKQTMDELKKKLPRLKDMPVGTYVGTIEGVTIDDLLAAGLIPLTELYDADEEEPVLVENIDYFDLPPFEPAAQFEALSTGALNELFCNKKKLCHIDLSLSGTRSFFGGEAREKSFSYVRQIVTVNKQSGKLETCTGTFVSSYIMITAAHCLEKADARYGILLKRIIHQDERNTPTNWIEAQSGSYQLHPDYFGLNGIESIPLDIAVIQWPSTLDSVRTSVKLMPYAHLPRESQEVDTMGFNRIIWKNGYQSADHYGQLRFNSNTLKAANNHLISVSGRVCRSLDKFGHCQFNGHLSFASQGDAGGPLFPVTTSFYLIGILCCGEALPTQKISQASNIAYYVPVWAPETRAFLKPALIKAGYDAELFPPGY